MPVTQMASKFNPLHIPNCALWLETDRGITLDGSNNVSAWADQSGNGRHVSQATEANRLAYVAGQINGYPVLRGDGTVAKYLSTALSGLNDLAGRTLICVYKYASATTVGSFCYSSRAAALQQATGTQYAYYGPGSYSHFSIADTVYHLRTTWFDGTQVDNASRFKLYIDGTAKALTYDVAVPVNTGLMDSLKIGGQWNSNIEGARMVGDVAAFIFYSRALTTSERQRIERFYGQKYGITVA